MGIELLVCSCAQVRKSDFKNCYSYQWLGDWTLKVVFTSPQVSCSPVRLLEGAIPATCFVIKTKLQNVGNN